MTQRNADERRGERLDLILNGVTHRVEFIPVNDDRWEFMLTVWSPAGQGEALLTANDCQRIAAYLGSGGHDDPGFVRDPRCRCGGSPAHIKGSTEDCIYDPD